MTLNYGLFINAILNFLIVAFVLFLVVRQINRLQGRTRRARRNAEDILLLRETATS